MKPSHVATCTTAKKSKYMRNQIIDILFVLVDDNNIPKTYIVMVIYRTSEFLVDQW